MVESWRGTFRCVSTKTGSQPSRRRWLRLILAILALVAAGPVVACPICLNGRSFTLAQKLDAADRAILAVRLPSESRLRVVEVIKGDNVVDEILPERAIGVEAPSSEGGKPLLLVCFGPAGRWSSLGPIGSEHAGWLRQLIAFSHAGSNRPIPAWPQTADSSSEFTVAQWRERVALVVPYLEDPEPLAAEIAYGEFARAPYEAQRSVKPQFQAREVANWINDPKLASRRSAYTLLLGIIGTLDDASRLEQRIDAALASHDATDLAAMLAADLELRGSSRIGWIEATYFADRSRTLPEIEAALLALSVHGGANAKVPRQRVIEAYLFFTSERKPMAGFVAPQLADWEYWDATPEFVALLEANALQDPASHFAVLTYLNRSPHPAAKAALASLADKSP